MKLLRSSSDPLPLCPTDPMQVDRVALLSSAHFIIDIYPGFVAPMLPLLMTRIGFSLPMAGLLVSISAVFNSLAQPFFAHFADKSKKPYLVIYGPLVSAVFMAFFGLINSYFGLLLCVILSGIGTAAFHPQSAVYTSKSGGNRSGMAMSLFVTGGTAGHSLAPLIIIPIVTLFGIQWSFITVIFGILITILLNWSLPRLPHPPKKHVSTRQTSGIVGKKSAFILLWCVVTVRAFIISSFITFMPIFLHNKNFSLFLSGSAITVFEFSGAFGALAGGGLSDLIGRKKVVVLSMLLSMPCLYFFITNSGIASFILLAVAGLFIYTSIPVVILFAQELYPNRINMVSSLIMGVSWGVGGLLVTPIGILGEHIGLGNALLVITGIGVMTAVIAMFVLPETLPHKV